MNPTEVAQSKAARWAEKIVEAYAAAAKPALPSEAQNGLKQHIADELTITIMLAIPSNGWHDCVNRALGEWEDLTGFSGPRLLSVDEVAETVKMVPRAEAPRPMSSVGDDKHIGCSLSPALVDQGRARASKRP